MFCGKMRDKTWRSIPSAYYLHLKPGADFSRKFDMSNDSAFNRDEALKRVDGDAELLFELVDIFFDDYPQALADVRAALEMGDTHRVEQRAHSMKSALGNIGAQLAYETATALERSGKDQHLEEVRLLVKKLEADVESFRDTVKKYR
jgi:HPt (histidine-containing phosphotransfer) domain-containing protein